MTILKALKNFITKSGGTTKAGTIAEAIRDLPTGINVEELSVTENGTYTAEEGKAFSPVVVNVYSGGATEPYIEETYSLMGELVAAKMVGHNMVREGLFRFVDSLTAVSLPDGITLIGSEAFVDSALCYPELPNKTTAETLTINLLNALKALDLSLYPPEIAEELEMLIENLGYFPPNEYHYYFLGLVDAVKYDFSDVVPYMPADVVDALSAILAYHETIAMRALPDSVKVIKNGAFKDAFRLELTSLPSSLETIGPNAFNGCRGISITKIPQSTDSIGEYAFFECEHITSITFEGTPSDISLRAFSYCTNLTTINVPWAENEVANAPWGATNATINYNYTPGA